MKRTSFLLIFPLWVHALCATPFSESSFEVWGVDADLPQNKHQTHVHEELKTPFARKIGASMIVFFQNYISPIDGPRSSFYPTSSQYALDAIHKYGLLTGIALGCDRLMRENHEDWIYDIVDVYGTARKLDPVQ